MSELAKEKTAKAAAKRQSIIDAVEASAYDVKIARTVVDLFLNGMGRKD
jgi:hypothetical protein